ncbi:reverse transcriptase domain-containing protein, partial [Curtobacterium sp. VKM Ac-2887]|uniref:reverse transcriptase domain-containing protein n=1 Tax=Curtobacterium sp. VKM Ac-2887 TaxID=2783819 RepID=UPI0019F1D52C
LAGSTRATGSRPQPECHQRDDSVHLDADPANLIAGLTTVRNSLPVGFSTSPALANVAMFALDADLSEYARSRNLALSRYADDLALSSNEEFHALDDIRNIVSRHGQELREDKTKRLKFGQPQYVTGLSTSSGYSARLPRPMKRSLRQHCFYIEKFGLEGHASARAAKGEELRLKVAGTLSYARSVEPQWVDDLLSAHPEACAVLFPRVVEVAEKRAARLATLAKRVKASPAPKAPAYEPTWTYIDA